MNPVDATRWSAPNTEPSPMAGGVRFCSTNGLLPSVSNSTAAAAVVYRTHQPIPTRFVSRGYAAADLIQNPRLTVDLQTWDPMTSIVTIAGGVQERHLLDSERTQDRTAYHFSAPGAVFEETNANGDFLEPGRKDYSVALGEGGVDHVHLDGGVQLDLHQESRWEQVVPVDRARVMQFEVSNAQGRVRIVGMRMDSAEAGQRQGELA